MGALPGICPSWGDPPGSEEVVVPGQPGSREWEEVVGKHEFPGDIQDTPWLGRAQGQHRRVQGERGEGCPVTPASALGTLSLAQRLLSLFGHRAALETFPSCPQQPGSPKASLMLGELRCGLELAALSLLVGVQDGATSNPIPSYSLQSFVLRSLLGLPWPPRNARSCALRGAPGQFLSDSGWGAPEAGLV